MGESPLIPIERDANESSEFLRLNRVVIAISVSTTSRFKARRFDEAQLSLANESSLVVALTVIRGSDNVPVERLAPDLSQ